MTEISDSVESNQHYPASIEVLEYNARMRRKDTANANEYWRANFADDDWPLSLTYSQAAAEHDRAVEALKHYPELVLHVHRLQSVLNYIASTAWAEEARPSERGFVRIRLAATSALAPQGKPEPDSFPNDPDKESELPHA